MSTNTIKYSDEQLAAIHSSARSMKIVAVAGSGKTTLLDGFARHRWNLSVLYLAFNRAIRDDAARRFPQNVTCMTGHGLAHSAIGYAYKHKIGDPKPYHVCAALPCTMVDAALALQTIQRWLVSDADTMDEAHLPCAGTAPSVLALASVIWSKMADLNDPMPISHDGYFKLYCLTNPHLPFDVILFDEFQDANPVTVRLIQQQSCTKVYVGDPHQSIYQFRGAVNALASVAVDAAYPLSVSFRYGQGIADVANRVLSTYSDDVLPIHGQGRHLSSFAVDPANPHAVLSRTNTSLFGEAVRLYRDGRSFRFHGGHDGYRLAQFVDAYHLRCGNKSLIRSPVIRAFRDYQDFLSYTEATEDKELRSLASIVSRYGHGLPRLVEEIVEFSSRPDPAAVVLTTGHRAKGLEFDSVRLLPDFTDMGLVSNPDGSLVPPDAQEINLLYVALTRSCRALDLPPALQAWVQQADPGLYAGIAADRVSGGQAALPASFWLSQAGAQSVQSIQEYLRDPERYPNAQADIMALMGSIIEHLDSGALRLMAPTLAPAQAAELMEEPESFLDNRRIVSLWMSGLAIEEIALEMAAEPLSVLEALSQALGVRQSDLKEQNLRRCR